MTGDAPVSDKATARPWRTANRRPRHICDDRGFKIAKCLQSTKGANFVLPDGEAEANAALIVAAVNSFDESRACLEWGLADIEGRARYETPEQREACIARIRAHLGE